MSIYQRISRAKDGARKKTVWYVDFVHKGQRFVSCIGAVSRTVAKEEETRMKAAVVEGRLNPAKAQKSPLFAAFMADYIQDLRTNRKPQSVIRAESAAKHLLPFFGSKKLSDLTAWQVEQYKKARKEDGSASATVNIELTFLKAMLRKAHAWGKLTAPPVVKLLKHSAGKTRVLSDDEESRLLAFASPALRRLIHAGLLTGFRRQELVMLRPEDVDLERGLITVAACYAKSGESRTLPIGEQLKAVLQDALSVRGAAPTVFVSGLGKPWHPVGVTQVFKATCKRAGMEILSPHVMRHTFASRLTMAGVDLRTVQELMGHKSIAMTIRYAHLSPDHKRAAISALENRLSEKSPIPAHNTPHPVPSAPHAKVTAIR